MTFEKLYDGMKRGLSKQYHNVKKLYSTTSGKIALVGLGLVSAGILASTYNLKNPTSEIYAEASKLESELNKSNTFIIQPELTQQEVLVKINEVYDTRNEQKKRLEEITNTKEYTLAQQQEQKKQKTQNYLIGVMILGILVYSHGMSRYDDGQAKKQQENLLNTVLEAEQQMNTNR